MRKVLTSLIAAAALSISAANADAASRGISVKLKAGQSPDAAVTEEVRLYGASHALVIGIDNYTGGWPRLSNAIRDARKIGEALQDRGFDVSVVTDPTGAQLETALKEFFVVKGADPQARLFVWFAGHGHTKGGEGFLVPADAPRPEAGARFKLVALPMRRFGEYVRLAESKHAFAIFDACFAGTVFDTQRSLPPAAITRATTLPVRQFLTSGDADQTVSDDGTFRELFLRALSGEERADANGDGYVTASEMGLFLGDRVTNLSQSRQTPRYGKLRDKDFDRGDFVFVLPSRAAQHTETGGGSAAMELAFWNAIKDSADAATFEAYLQQFPQGTFAPLAKLKVRELGGTQTAALSPATSTPADTALVLARDANVRAQADRKAEKVGFLPAGTAIDPTETVRRGGETWHRVELPNKTVTISARISLTVKDIVTTGDGVLAGDEVVNFDHSALRSRGRNTQNQLDAAKISAAHAEEDLARTSKLHKAQVVSTRQLDEAKTSLAMERQYVARLENMLLAIKVEIQGMDLRSPIGGTVVEQLVEKGAYVQPGQKLLVIRGMSRSGYVRAALLKPPGKRRPVIEPINQKVMVREPLKVYARPSEESRALPALSPGKFATIVGRVKGTDWHKVAQGGKVVGFTRGVVTGADRPATPFGGKSENHYEAVTGSNIRAGPSKTSKKIGHLNAGDRPSVVGQTILNGERWHQVKLAEGGTGYVYGRLLELRPN